MRWLALILVLAGCDVVLSFETLGPLGARHRKPITIHNGATTLVDFPISVAFDADPELAATAQDADHVAFTYADGSPIDCEIVNYDPATGALDAWLRLPSLPPDATTIDLVYGPRETACVGTVWSDSVVAAWHEPDAMGVFYDRSVHRHNTSPPFAAATPTIVPGIAGRAASFDGVDDATCAPNDSDGSLAFGTSSFSYSVWVMVTVSHADYDRVWFKGAELANSPGFDMRLGKVDWTMNVADGSSEPQAAFGTETLGRWVQLVAVVDRVRSRLDAYSDGFARQSTALTALGSVTGSAPLCLGASSSDLFSGILDEPRLYDVALGADWIAAEHANLADRDNFMTIGREQRYE